MAMFHRPQTHWATSKRPSKISVPEHAHPAVRLMFGEMARQRVTYQEMEFRSGVLVSTQKSWRNEKTPSFRAIEATLGALGWAFVPVCANRRVPAWVLRELDDIAARWNQEDPLLHTLLARTCGAPIAALGGGNTSTGE
jgi:hypothetical protein